MNISLTPELEQLVNQKVESGMYHSASEVIREGLRLLKDQDDLKRIRFDELHRDISKGIDSFNRGKAKPFDVKRLKSEGRKRLASRKRA
jgi:antitoxin ParD1/3/4